MNTPFLNNAYFEYIHKQCFSSCVQLLCSHLSVSKNGVLIHKFEQELLSNPQIEYLCLFYEDNKYVKIFIGVVRALHFNPSPPHHASHATIWVCELLLQSIKSTFNCHSLIYLSLSSFAKKLFNLYTTVKAKRG